MMVAVRSSSGAARRGSAGALPPLVQAMLEPAFYPGPRRDVELVQTHISFVLLAGDEVFKVKKPVRFSFLDFSTLERRHHYCREELRLNRRLASGVYLGVVSICATGSKYRLGDEEDPAAVEYAVRMKRLPAAQMFSAILARGEANDSHVDAIARRLVEFHGVAEAGPEVAANGSPAALLAVMDDDFSESVRYRGVTISAADDVAIQEFCRNFVASHAELLQTRQRTHRIRECHGDLRAEHICFVDGLQMIDCIEFDGRFRNRDVAAEVAFLAMDIEHLGHRGLAERLIESYARFSGDADLARLVPFYQCYFAYIRGKVGSLTSLEEEVGEAGRQAAARDARSHFAQAHRYTWSYSPALVAVSGLSGSGKTTVAGALQERLGFAHFNSDVVRKELAGCATNRPATPQEKEFLYAADLSRRTYARMLELGRGELVAGRGVILDATFQRRAHRQAVYDLARDLGAAVLFVECRCDPTETRRRLAARTRAGVGPSDADWEVFLAQQRNYEEFAPGEQESRIAVDTADPLAAVVVGVEDELRRRLRR